MKVFAVELGTYLSEKRIIPEGDPLLEMTYKTMQVVARERAAVGRRLRRFMMNTN